MKTRDVVLACWIAVLGIGCVSAAQDEDYCTRPVRVALFEFGILYRASTNDGIDPQLLDEIHKRTGCEFQRVVLPRNRIWAELQNGSLDLATGAIPTPERKAYGFLLPYLKSRNVVLIRKGVASKIQTMADLEDSKLRIGVVRGFRHEATYDALVARLTPSDRVVKAADVAEDFRLFDEGIVDVIFSQPMVFGQYLTEDYLGSKVAFRDWAPKDEMSIGALILSRKSFTPEQARNWDALLVKMQKEGSLMKIFRSFLSSSQAKELVFTGPRSPDWYLWRNDVHAQRPNVLGAGPNSYVASVVTRIGAALERKVRQFGGNETLVLAGRSAGNVPVIRPPPRFLRPEVPLMVG